MNVVTLGCRDCESEIEFASSFMQDENPTKDEMQAHMDANFLARCGHCFACNWEVLMITETQNGNWVLDRDEFTELTVPDWLQKAELSKTVH